MDSAPDFLYCLNALREAEQLPALTQSEVTPAISHGSEAMLAVAFPDNPLAYKHRFLQTYIALRGKHACLFEGLSEMLDFLNAHNIIWGIVTNKHREHTLPLLERFPVLKTAKILICGDSLSKPKPHALPLLYAAENLKVAIADCLFIGDSQVDLEAAKRANMTAAFVNYGYGERCNLPAAYTFETSTALSAFIQDHYDA